MKFALISDTHGQLPEPQQFSGADLVFHAGDIGPDYQAREWIQRKFHPWCSALEQMGIGVHYTVGNHDMPEKWENAEPWIDEIVMCHGKKVWFSPWSVTFGNWAWMTSEPELFERYSLIPKDTEIIISHTPPFKLCDRNLDGLPCGSKALRVRIQELPKLRYVICGHIHEAHGESTCGNVTILNVSSVDERYQLRNEPITWLEIDE